MTKSTKCSICTLPSEKLAAVDQSLRDGAPLQAISDRTGVSKSSLWRHSRHIAPAAGSDPPPTTAAVVRKEKRRPQATPEPTAVVPSARVQPAPALVDRETALAEALDRAELLFREALAGLEDTKRPIALTKPDGSEIELPGDLRSRAGFIRAARDVLDQLARLRGLFEPDPAPRFGEVVFQNVILMPKIPSLEPPEPTTAGQVIEGQITVVRHDSETADIQPDREDT